MADDTENQVGEEPGEPEKTSFLVHVVVFLMVTAIASGAGFGAAMFAFPDAAPSMAASKEMPSSDKSDDEKMSMRDKNGETEDEEASASAYARPLPSILTNLAAPKDVWVRMELAVVAKESVDDEMLENIHQDLLAYMRTVKLHHVSGPSGFLNLRAELDDRASIRSNGAVGKVLIRTLLFE